MLSQADDLLIQHIRQRDAEAWNELIARFEGRLLKFVEGRTRNRAAAEDVVQETFIGFLTSLPNFDQRRPLEAYLFSIAAHKLTDALRREGRRPTLPLSPNSSDPNAWEPVGSDRPASSIARIGRTPPIGGNRAAAGDCPADRRSPPRGAMAKARVRGIAAGARLAEQAGGGQVGHFRTNGGQLQA